MAIIAKAGRGGRGGICAALALWSAPVAAQDPLPPPTSEVILEVSGAISHPATSPDGVAFDLPMQLAFEQREIVTTTTVTDGPCQFEGVLVRDLLGRLGAQGGEVRAIAHNDYVIEIPLRDFQDYDVILAHSMDGRPLLRRDKGPLWIIYPRDRHPEVQDIRYDYRWVWQLRRIEVE